MDILAWICGIGPLACLIGAYWWERPRYKNAQNRRLIERGYGFLLDNDEYNDALGSEEVLVQKPLQKTKVAKTRNIRND